MTQQALRLYPLIAALLLAGFSVKVNAFGASLSTPPTQHTQEMLSLLDGRAAAKVPPGWRVQSEDPDGSVRLGRGISTYYGFIEVDKLASDENSNPANLGEAREVVLTDLEARFEDFQLEWTRTRALMGVLTFEVGYRYMSEGTRFQGTATVLPALSGFQMLRVSAPVEFFPDALIAFHQMLVSVEIHSSELQAALW